MTQFQSNERSHARVTFTEFSPTLYERRKAAAARLRALILPLQPSRSLRKSKTDTMATTKWRFLPPKEANSNVSLPVRAHLLSLTNSLIDRSNVGALLSTAENPKIYVRRSSRGSPNGEFSKCDTLYLGCLLAAGVLSTYLKLGNKNLSRSDR